MNVLLTGATGFIGKTLLPRLLEKLSPADTLYVLSRSEFTHPDSRVIRLNGSLEQIMQFSNELLSCEYIFHLAALAVFGKRYDYTSVNLLPVQAMTVLLKTSIHLRNFIFVSTIGAADRHSQDRCDHPITTASIPNPRSAYGRSKLDAEACISSAGIPFTIIRPAWVYGRNMRADSHINSFVSLVVRNAPVSRFAFPGKVSVIHAEDLCKALINIIGNNTVIGKTYFAQTQSISIGDLFHLIRKNISSDILPQLPITPPVLRWILARCHHLLPITVTNLFIDYLVACDDAFRQELCCETPISIEQGISDVIATNPEHTGYWVVTGANSGIGLSLARRLDRTGRKLILVDRETGMLDAEFSSRHIIMKCDLAREESLRACALEITRHPIRTLVNNAGIGFRGGVSQISDESIAATIDVNVRAPLMLTRLLLKNITACRGTVVNVASSTAFSPLPFMSVYAASKAFWASWSLALAYELAGTVQVVTVAPSGTKTNFQKQAGVEDKNGGLLDSDHVARRIIRAVDEKQGFVVIGTAPSRLLLFVSRLLPPQITAVLWGRLFERLR